MGFTFVAPEVEKLRDSSGLKVDAIKLLASRRYDTLQELKDDYAAGKLGIGTRHYLYDNESPYVQYIITPYGICSKDLLDDVPPP